MRAKLQTSCNKSSMHAYYDNYGNMQTEQNKQKKTSMRDDENYAATTAILKKKVSI